MKRPRRSLSLAAGAVLVLLTQQGAPAEEKLDHLGQLSGLKADYTQSVSRTEDPEELTALGIAFAGRTWAVAGRVAAERRQRADLVSELDKKEMALLKEISTGRRTEDRQVLGMDLLFKSVYTLAALDTQDRGDKASFKEVEAIQNHLDRTLEPSRSKGYNLVAWSNGVVGMLALAVRTVDHQHKLAEEVNRILEAAVMGARAVGVRSDLHARARLMILALNNIRGCFKLTCVYGQALNERLVPEMDSLREAWLKNYSDDQQPAVALVATTTALAQATFAVAKAYVRR
ncbi:MAG: hypothetical protein AB1641_12480 [Thermodesulfobacteriota bacterium]